MTTEHPGYLRGGEKTTIEVEVGQQWAGIYGGEFIITGISKLDDPFAELTIYYPHSNITAFKNLGSFYWRNEFLKAAPKSRKKRRLKRVVA